MLKLKCAVQNYEWGKRGEDSEVAKLMRCAFPEFEIKNDIPYAEMWIGTHPNGPSIILDSKNDLKTLAEWITANPQNLGTKNIEHFGAHLPFLLKVLSVNKALSIQAHPDKKLAEILHSEHPELYKDPNHKPEMALALTTFEALCGFRPVESILFFLKGIPELANVVGEENVKNLEENANNDETKSSLKKCFHALMICPDDVRERNLKALATKFSNEVEKVKEEDVFLSQIFLRIHNDFPGDVGCFAIYFLNYIELNPGEALFLGANEPHAYFYGDCVECMACSDNVVRAGLTPKYKDISTLCDMLTYSCSPPEEKLFQGTRLDDYSTIYSPPVPDFALIKIELPSEVNMYFMKGRESASLLLIVEGEALVCAESSEIFLRKGNALFVPAKESLRFTVKSDNLLAFQAISNV